MRYWSMILYLGAVCSAALGAVNSPTPEQLEKDGRSLFLSCEFKLAARAFERVVAERPDRAMAYYWLGKSYARLADVSGPLTAPKYARKAGRNLEQAVRIEPSNEEYARELFEFYVDSPEWFGGGLTRARAMIEEIGVADSVTEPALQRIAESRNEHSGAPWRMRQAILRASGIVGTVVPAR